MFQQFVNLYNQAVQEGNEAQWKRIQEELKPQDFWDAIKEQLARMNVNDYPFLAEEYLIIDDLIEAMRNFVKEDAGPRLGRRYASLYGRNSSDQNYKDLIDLAKVIALYHNKPNYHKYLLGEQVVEESNLTAEKLYLKRHSQLFALPYQEQFDLIPVAEIDDNLRIRGELINFYHPGEAVNVEEVFGHPDSPLHHEYQRLKAQPYGNITRPIYHALKAFVEVVSNEFDAHHFIESCWCRPRVAKKEKAFREMNDVLGALPPEDREALNALTINRYNTFEQRIDNVVNRGSCVSQFADDITRLLCQCDPEIQFTNPRAVQIKNDHALNLQAIGRVLDTTDVDSKYLEDLSKVILHTEFRVKIGTKVTDPNNDEESNRVPSHVAEMFNICQKGLRGEMNASEARYKAIKVASRCYNKPHDSFLFFLNTRDLTTQNFYGMVLEDKFTSLIAENNSLHEQQSFLRGV